MMAEYALGVYESMESILGSDGKVGKRFPKLDVADASFCISALGEAMYVSRWFRGGMARARRQ